MSSSQASCAFLVRLKREVGENPTRSRHCKLGVTCIIHCTNLYGKEQGTMTISQETCLLFHAPKQPTRIGGVRQKLAFIFLYNY